MVDEPDLPNGVSPDDMAAAGALDARIDAVLAGRPSADDPAEVLWLASAVRTDPPPSVAVRVETRFEAAERRRWRPVRYAAFVVAYLFISQGLGNLLWGDWVAEGVGDTFSPHASREAAFALIAAGLAVGTAVVWRRMVPVAFISGVPLAVLFGVFGIGEVGVFAAGAVLHLSQGVAGLALAVAAWRYRYRRYT